MVRWVAIALVLVGCGGSSGNDDGGTGTSGPSPTDDGDPSTGTPESSGDPGDGSTQTSGGDSTTDPGESSSSTDDGPPETCPEPPAGLSRWLTGDEADADVVPTGPGLILMGGGYDTIAALQWWKDYLQGGDVVVLRASGDDGYNDFLYGQIGGVDSVETLRVPSSVFANDPYVACRIRQAEGVFIAGGDQAEYMTQWKDTELAAAVDDVYARGGIVGGTSAGLAVLGQWVYAAYGNSVVSSSMLDDPYNPAATLDQALFELPLAQGVITDSHFAERDRMGRLVGFVARIIADGWAAPPGESVVGIGVDEDTSLVVGPDGTGTVYGPGRVYVVRSNGAPQTCQQGAPLTFTGLQLLELGTGDTVTLPGAESSVAPTDLAVVEGSMQPADPY